MDLKMLPLGVALSLFSTVSVASDGPGVPALEYNAAFGTFPIEQGWNMTMGTFDGDDEIVGGALHLDVADGDRIVFKADAGDLDWNDGMKLSMRVRVLEGTVSGEGRRGGAALIGKDALGHVYAVLVGDDHYVFSSHSNQESDPVLTIEREFDGASAFHTYCIVSHLEGAVLEIDGVPRAYVPVGDEHESLGSFVAQWSVNSKHAGVVSEWTNVTLASDEPCVADLNGDCRVDSGDLAILLAGWGVCH